MKKRSVLNGRKVSVENAALIGGGYCADVYLVSEDTVIKVLKNGDNSSAEREIMLAKWAMIRGIPTAISFDVADVDGKPGLVYEYLGSKSLRDKLRDEPESFVSLMRSYASLLHSIHAVQTDDIELPDCSEVFSGRVEILKPFLRAAEFARLAALVTSIPRSGHLIHGDCHVKNIMVNESGLYLIDLETLSVGDPIYEFAELYCVYRAFVERSPEEQEKFMGLPAEMLTSMMDALTDLYFDGVTEREKELITRKIAVAGYIYLAGWYILDYPEDTASIELFVGKLKELLFTVDDLDLHLAQ